MKKIRKKRNKKFRTRTIKINKTELNLENSARKKRLIDNENRKKQDQNLKEKKK